MKRILSTLLALTFLLYLGGMQAIYWIELGMHKQQSHVLIQKNNFSTADTKTFSLTPIEYKSLSWSEENKEFSYQGQHYDIIGMQFFSDEILLKCYIDRDETNLIDAFSGFINKMFASPQHSSNTNTDIVSKLYKEYLPTKFFMPSFFSQAPISIGAVCVLVNVSAKIDNIWHPPTLV